MGGTKLHEEGIKFINPSCFLLNNETEKLKGMFYVPLTKLELIIHFGAEENSHSYCSCPIIPVTTYSRVKLIFVVSK